MTKSEIIEKIQSYAPGYSRSTFDRDRKRLGIMPRGEFRQNPQQFSFDDLATILRARGIHARPATKLPPLDTAATRLATVSQLKATAKKARGAK